MQVAEGGLRRLVLFVRKGDLPTPPNNLLRQFKKSGGPDGVHIPDIRMQHQAFPALKRTLSVKKRPLLRNFA